MIEKKNPIVLSASTIEGTDVYNPAGEKIGNISEVMLDLDYGQISYAVLQFGGIMGLGDKLFAIPWSALELDTENEQFILSVDKEKFEESRGFDKDNWPEMADYTWLTETYKYYGYDPYWD